jgi:glucan phosphorylase
VLGDLEQLLPLVTNPDRPIQIIFAGKAHPADEPGKALIRKIANLRRDPRVGGRIVFVEDYDINVCRHLIQGVDVWLNNPRRPLEASGTSGQKVVFNGGLNCSILDGWWAEAFDGRNGFAIGRRETHARDEITDRRDSEALYSVLENEVIPTFYERDSTACRSPEPQVMLHCVVAGVNVELFVDPPNVAADGVGAHAEGPRHLLVHRAGGEQLEDLAFAGAQIDIVRSRWIDFHGRRSLEEPHDLAGHHA